MDLLLISAAETAADDGGFLGVVKAVNDAVSGVVWGWPALILLLFVGVLMSVLTKFFQISHIGRWFRCTIGAVFKDRKVTAHTKDKQISQFQSVCAALASTVGTGDDCGRGFRNRHRRPRRGVLDVDHGVLRNDDQLR